MQMLGQLDALWPALSTASLASAHQGQDTLSLLATMCREYVPTTNPGRPWQAQPPRYSSSDPEGERRAPSATGRFVAGVLSAGLLARVVPLLVSDQEAEVGNAAGCVAVLTACLGSPDVRSPNGHAYDCSRSDLAAMHRFAIRLVRY